MDIWSWLQEVAILIVVCEITSGKGDLLESFRPKEDNPPELNEFLSTVLEHKDDFNFVKEAARKYHKMKKQALDPSDTYNIFSNDDKTYNKRHVHRLNNYRRYKNSDLLQRYKIPRHRRELKRRIPEIIMLQEEDDTVKKRMPLPIDVQPEKKKVKEHLPSQIFIEPEAEPIQKRTPEEIEVESEGETGKLNVDDTSKIKEKKQAVDIDKAVHGTYKANARHGIRNGVRKQGDYYYVDLQGAAERDLDRYQDRRRFNWEPPRQNLYYRYNRPYLDRGPNPVNMEYPQYEMEPHHSLNDEIAFEKALSYEVEPKYPERFNNPDGNNLYSVDGGRPDTIQMYPQRGYQGPPGPPQEPVSITNERFYIDPQDNVKRLETTTDTTTTTSKINDGAKQIKRVGNGFIEVTKTRRDNEEDQPIEEENKEKDREKSSILAKHSLHPLRLRETEDEEADEEDHFIGRKLQFFDDGMSNLYHQNEDYDDVPYRPRRDFLDALGMKNEEDYTEDNPYKDVITMNNTDIRNDTHIHNITTPRPCTLKTTTKCHVKEDIKNIKHILEEPKEVTGVTVIGEFKPKKQAQRAKKNTEFEDFDDLDEVRLVRGTDKEDIERKILKNMGKIYNPNEDRNSNHVQVRQERTLPQLSEEFPKLSDTSSEPIEINPEITKIEDTESTTLFSPTFIITTEVSPESTNTNYEQVAHQMDLENEKLAQVVNGHLASKIVSTVFEELKKQSHLKAKFYPGLSRKHVNFGGTMDFDIFATNGTEGVDEARLLLEQITKVLNRLVLNQVRRKLCQRLPDDLKDYLDVLLNVKISLDNTNFVPNTKQGDFLFTYQEEKVQPPFDVQKLQQILVKLEGLLLSYQSMNADCRNRAEPVKDYIEKHVKMLKKIVNCPSRDCDNKLSEVKRDALGLMERQLESVGLGNKRRFVPNFDLDRLVKNRLKVDKSNRKRDLKKGDKSQQYRKLQRAVERIREKRENEKKIAELFGGKMKRSAQEIDVDYEEPVVYSLG